MATYDRGRNVVFVGVLVIVAVLAFGGVFYWLTDRLVGRDRSELHVALETAAGLKEGDPVLYRGVPVGKVSDIGFEAGGGVLIDLMLTRSVPLRSGATAELRAVDVFGAVSVVLVDGPAGGPSLGDGSLLRGMPALSLTERADTITRQAQRFLADSTLAMVRGLLIQGRETTGGIESLVNQASATLAEQTPLISRATADIAGLVAKLNGAADSTVIQQTLSELKQAAAGLTRLTMELSSLAGGMRTTVDRLNDGGGTASLLLNDPRLYEQTTSALAALERLLVDLQQNPKRYVTFSLF